MNRIIREQILSNRRILLAAALCGFTLLPAAGHAQDVQVHEADVSAMTDAINKSILKSMERRINVGPTIVKVDPKTMTAELEFSNTTSDTLDAEVLVSTMHPGMIMPAKTAAPQKASPLLDANAPGKGETIQEKWSMVSWLKDVPQKIRLAPGEKKKITVKVQGPASPAAGDYSAWVIAVTEASKVASNAEGTVRKTNAEVGTALVDEDGNPMRIPSVTKVLYTAGAK